MRLRAFLALSCWIVAPLAHADDASCVAASEQELQLRQQGKLHDALKQLAACADPSCPDEVKQECVKRIGDIDTIMPSIIFEAKDLVGTDLDQVTVTMDGAAFTDRLDGRSITVDPGEHKFRFTFSPAPPVDKTIVIREGERDRHESVVIPISPPKPPPFWGPQRVIALGTGVLGVVGLALGGTFAGFAVSAQNQEKSDCGQGCDRYAQALADYNTAQTNATASTTLFIVGGVLAATAIVLWLTSPHGNVSAAPTAARAFILGGTF